MVPLGVKRERASFSYDGSDGAVSNYYSSMLLGLALLFSSDTPGSACGPGEVTGRSCTTSTSAQTSTDGAF